MGKIHQMNRKRIQLPERGLSLSASSRTTCRSLSGMVAKAAFAFDKLGIG